jgi:hypothetical protein
VVGALREVSPDLFSVGPGSPQLLGQHLVDLPRGLSLSFAERRPAPVFNCLRRRAEGPAQEKAEAGGSRQVPLEPLLVGREESGDVLLNRLDQRLAQGVQRVVFEEPAPGMTA